MTSSHEISNVTDRLNFASHASIRISMILYRFISSKWFAYLQYCNVTMVIIFDGDYYKYNTRGGEIITILLSLDFLCQFIIDYWIASPIYLQTLDSVNEKMKCFTWSEHGITFPTHYTREVHPQENLFNSCYDSYLANLSWKSAFWRSSNLLLPL